MAGKMLLAIGGGITLAGIVGICIGLLMERMSLVNLSLVCGGLLGGLFFGLGLAFIFPHQNKEDSIDFLVRIFKTLVSR